MKRLLTLVLLCIASIAWSDESVDIFVPEQVSALANIQQKIDSVSSSVMGCIESGMSHKQCLCQNRQQIVDFNRAVRHLFVTYPDLAKQDLVRFKVESEGWVTQSLEGIRKQANSPLNC